MQIYSKTVPQLDAEHLSESLRRLETFLNYFQETTDHQIAQLRRKVEKLEAENHGGTTSWQATPKSTPEGTTSWTPS